MTPFQEFRLWLRRAPRGEVTAAGVAGAVILALVGYVVVPAGGGTAPPGGPSSLSVSSQGTTSGTGAPGAPRGTPGGATSGHAALSSGDTGGSSGPAGTSGAPGQGSGGAGSASNEPGAAGSTNAEGGRRNCPAATGVQGVSASQMKVAVTLVDVSGAAANSLFGIPAPDQQKAVYQAVIDSINAQGGIACRKVVPTYYTGNPTDQSGLQQTCLQIVQAKVFAELDGGAYANFPEKDCFAQHHIPFFGDYFITDSEVSQFYPYLFEEATYEELYRDTIFALRDRGFFTATHGFKKLGFVYRSCDPQLISAMEGWMHEAGVSSSQLVTYSVGCPSALASPSAIEQAVLTFQRERVTNVTTAEFLADFPNFTKIAQQQRFHPIYGLPDDMLIAISYGSLRPDYANIANAIAITDGRDGEERTPGIVENAGSNRCDAILHAHGLKPVHQQQAEMGNICNELWTLKDSAENAPALAQNTLASGLQRTGSIDYSYPQGPNNFRGNRVTTGGQYWRVTQFLPSCECWRVIDRTFHPSYPG